MAKNLKSEKQRDKFSIKAEIWKWQEIMSTDKGELRDEDQSSNKMKLFEIIF